MANGCDTCFDISLSHAREATPAAELAEYAAETTGRFWDVHEALMERGPALLEDDIARIAWDFNLPPRDEMDEPAFAAAQAKVRDDIESAERTGVRSDADFLYQWPPLCGHVG